MAPGDRGVQTLAIQAAPPEPGHVGSGPGFIDKDKPFRFQPMLPVAPSLALGHHVSAFLFRRVSGFFIPVTEPMEHVNYASTRNLDPLGGKTIAQLISAFNRITSCSQSSCPANFRRFCPPIWPGP